MAEQRPEFTRYLPPALVPGAERPVSARPHLRAAFACQLIAERQHLAPQRARRRVPIAEAVDAYAIGANRAVRRLPMGYRTTIIA